MALVDRLLSAVGLQRSETTRAARNPRGTRGVLGGKVLPDLSLWAQFQRVGGPLSPQQVSEIIRFADAGYMWQLMDLANEARQKDCHLQSVLQSMEESIAGLDWELVLPDKANRQEKRAAKAIEQKLRNHGSLPRLIAHQTGARYYGYAVAETLYEKQGSQIWARDWEFHPPRRFGFDIQTGKFVWRDWNQANEGVDFLAEHPLQFVTSRPRVTGDVPCREGLVRVLMWAALFRNWSISDWLKLGEIAWKPWRTGKYKKNAQDEEVDELIAILEGMTSSGVAAYPEDVEITVEWPGGGASGQKSTHAELIDLMGREMSKATLGQTETTEASKSSGYAQAKVHREMKQELRTAVARWVAADLSRDVIGPLTMLNFGAGCRPARMMFLTDDPANVVEFANALDKLTGPNVKMRIGAQWAREQMGIPEPEDDEEMLGPWAELPEVDIPIDPNTGLPAVAANEPGDDAAEGEKPADGNTDDKPPPKGDGEDEAA